MEQIRKNTFNNGYINAILVLVILSFAAYHATRFITILDDAFISFRVALNWVQTGIPVFNLDYKEWVPTNLLWIAILTGVNKITAVPLPQLSQIIGGFTGAGTLVILLLLPHSQKRSIRIIAAILCACSSPWAAWVLTGLEAPLQSFLITWAIFLIADYLEKPNRRNIIWSGFLLGLATLNRPEAVLLFAITLALLILINVREAIKYSLPYGLMVLPAVAYLWSTFDSIIPTSYFVKVNGLKNMQFGKEYLRSLASTYKLLWFLPLMILPLYQRQSIKSLLYITVIVCAHLVWVYLVGGDFMPYYRYISPMWPLICFGIAFTLVKTIEVIKNRWPANEKPFNSLGLLAAAIISLCFLLPSYYGRDHRMLNGWINIENDRALIGKWLGNTYEPQAWVAVKPAGRISYYSRLNVLDFYCLTSRKACQTAEFIPSHWVGHQRVNVDYVIEKKPDIIILDDHLYPLNDLPLPDAGDGIVEKKWRESSSKRFYSSKKVEIRPGGWLQYYEIIK